MGTTRDTSKAAAPGRDGPRRPSRAPEPPYAGLLELQRTAGNRAVTVMLSRLAVGPVADPFENEADRIADSIMRMTEPAPVSADPQLDAMPVRRLATGVGSEGGELSPDLEASVTGVLRSGGRPLPSVERAFFESRMGYDLGAVRIHDNPVAARTSQAINARAFTVGSNIAFGDGAYQPGTTSGRRLLAHELTHVVQQGGAELKDE